MGNDLVTIKVTGNYYDCLTQFTTTYVDVEVDIDDEIDGIDDVTFRDNGGENNNIFASSRSSTLTKLQSDFANVLCSIKRVICYRQ